MKILFLGSVTSPENVINLSGASVAGNKMQYYVLKYLAELGNDIKVVSQECYAHYPVDKKLFVRKKCEVLCDKINVIQIPYINLPILKELITPYITWVYARKYVDENTVVLAYNVYNANGLALHIFGKKYNKDSVLFADPPVSEAKGGRLKNFIKNFFDSRCAKYLKSVNNVIALNKNAVDYYCNTNNYLIVDGGVEPAEYNLESEDNIFTSKKIVYTGALTPYSGIINLINAMDYIDDSSIELDIYGSGVLKEDVENLCKKSCRANYKGVCSNKEVLKIQRNAWLLVNPRDNTDFISKMTFPSKIFEYIMSRRPVLSTKLNGFSSDYDDKIFWAEDNSEKSLADSINKISKISRIDLDKMAETARNFLLSEKTWEKNAFRINEFLKKL